MYSSCHQQGSSLGANMSILDGVTKRTAGRANAHDPVVAEADERIHKQVEKTAVQVQATHMHENLHVTDWIAAQQEDPILKGMMEWISSHKVQDLKHLLGDHAMMEEGMAILRERKKFTLNQGALYHCHTLARELEEALQFVVPMTHRVVAMNRGAIGTWDIRTNGKHCPCCKTSFGLLWSLHETCYGICDSWSDGKKLLLNFCGRGTGQAPEWLRNHLQEQHHQHAVWPHGYLEGENFAIPSPDEQTGGVVPPNADVDYWEIG